MDGNDSRSSSPGGNANQTAAAPSSGSKLREDQIQNAVSFLSHPKVRGSPKASKVSFLQQKGLTEPEIDEAFRRVPETPVPALPTTSQQPNATLSSISNHVSPHQYVQPLTMQQQQRPQEQQPVRWSQVALGAGFAAASAYAVKSLLWPFVSDKYTSWRGTRAASRPDAVVPLLASGSTDINVVADAIRAQTAELASSIGILKTLIAGLDKKQRPSSPEDQITASDIRQELHTIAASLNEIVSGTCTTSTTTNTAAAGPSALALENELTEIKNLLSEYLKTPRSGEHTPPGELHRTTPPGSYSSAQDRPLCDAPSPIQLNNTTTQGGGGETGRHPASYMEVLEMLERGETPPGIRDDINDKPPNPEQPPPPARMKPLPKPWEQSRQPSIDNGNTAAATPTLTRQNFYDHNNGEHEHENGGGGGGVIDLSPVVPDDVAYSPSLARQNHQQDQQQRRPGSEPNASPLTAATSIFEAATSSQGSPGVIAGRLSPSSEQHGRRGAGVATPTSLFKDTTPTMRDSNGDQDGAGRPPPVMTTTPPIFPDEGGLGRPTSRGWRPPPIPVPTLSPDNVVKGAEASGGGSGEVRGSVAGSQNSLGADFAAA